MAELFADIETSNDIEIALWIDRFQVVQQPSTPTDHHQQTAPAGVVLFMRTQVLGDLADPSREDGDLDFRRTGIRFATRKSPIKPCLRSLVIDMLVVCRYSISFVATRLRCRFSIVVSPVGPESRGCGRS